MMESLEVQAPQTVQTDQEDTEMKATYLSPLLQSTMVTFLSR